MNRKLRINIVLSLIYQIITVINGLFIPRLVLETFGSDVNGIVSSITQMLSIISFLDLGVGSVVQVALYGPLLRHDNKSISKVYASSKNYFSNISKILLVYIVFLCVYFGFMKDTGFSSIYTITLLLSIAISTIFQYLFGITNTLLLNADQKIYVVTILNIITTIINALATIICLKLNCSIQTVKFISSLIFIIRPLFLALYVKSHYKIDMKIKPDRNTLKNKWSGMVQHISTMLTNSIDYVILTLFSTLSSISVYSVYVMPLNSFRLIIESFSISYKSYFGNLLAKENTVIINKEFNKFELIIHYVSTVIFSTINTVLVSFALIYTFGVTDVNYADSLFSLWITAAYYLFSLRVIYTTIIFAAGHFKQTQNFCIIESLINISISSILVNYVGLFGVAIGTCLSTGYRLIASANYINNHILNRNTKIFKKLIVIDMLCIVLVFTSNIFISIRFDSFLAWFIDSLCIFIVNILICTFIYYISYKKTILQMLRRKKKND